jgi:NADH dehydrogenase FAD-containing subunit
MKKALAITMAILFALTLTSVTFAGEKVAPPASIEMKADPAKAPAKAKIITGEIISVDAEAKTITIKDRGRVRTVVIAVNDKMFADVKAGDKVMAWYTGADGKYTAKSIEYDPAYTELQAKYVKGSVTSIDKVAKTITVDNKATDKEEEIVITLDEYTLMNNDPLKGDMLKRTLAEIKVGDLVVIVYKKDIVKNIAIQIGIAPKKNN